MTPYYGLRISYGLQADPGKTQVRLQELCRTTRANEIVLMIFSKVYNIGHEILVETRRWMDMIWPEKQTLQDAGVSVSLYDCLGTPIKDVPEIGRFLSGGFAYERVYALMRIQE